MIVIMKIKTWFKYLIYISLIYLIVFGEQYYLAIINENSKILFDTNPFYLNFIMIILNGCIGITLGVEHLICEIRKEGNWNINLPKLVLMGVPSLYFSLTIFIYYKIINLPSRPIFILLKGGNKFITISQLILGYIIITSFYKVNKEK